MYYGGLGNMDYSRYIKFWAMTIGLFIILIASSVVIIYALWNDNYSKATFFLLCFMLQAGFVKALMEYGNKLIKERKMDNEKN